MDTTKNRQAKGLRRKLSLDHEKHDSEAWEQAYHPSPSHAPGCCKWCGGELRDPERTHCDVDEGCFWQYNSNEMDRRGKAGLPVYPGGLTWKEMNIVFDKHLR